ncbi:unnamed protein product [Cylindrotheca closterium]|uniref:cGMP-dependent protein kinase n=1 Tax=Cylindrotheca closterium TaxID=2856 RepID=A0AAD2G4J1_9STRA|nr:unnamed protein product [Cylindrotheca closterium]
MSAAGTKDAVQEDAESKSIPSLDGTIASVGDKIGSGSYGTVHKLMVDDDNNNNSVCIIGKRPWKQDELKASSSQRKEDGKDVLQTPKERAERCMYYWEVEDHCFRKLPLHPQLPPHLGIVQDDSKEHDWMAFGLVTNARYKGKGGGELSSSSSVPAPTLADLMKLDDAADDNTNGSPQELLQIGKHLGCNSYGETLDTVLESLLTVLHHVHRHEIVHRDIKPSNLLVQLDDENDDTKGRLVLMDFGSAADLEYSTFTVSNGLWKSKQQVLRGLENGSRVAVSPIYCAPEVFVNIKEAPTAFDIFSSGLLFCQLLFGYLDERTDAGFHQQLEDAQWDLNVWLSNELGSKLRPRGLDYSLEYLAERPGLWSLLEEMLRQDPLNRPTAKTALARFQAILESSKQVDDDDENIESKQELDGPFFNMVIECMETCPIPTITRALHYVATFSRRESLGLVLSEYDEEDEEDDESNSDPEWLEATKFAQVGEVFIKEIVPGGQADRMGEIFEVGDQLQGVGDLPLSGGGFEKAVEMLQDLPKNSKNVKLHFDRISVRSNEAIPMIPNEAREVHLTSIGAWSSKGRRNYQEDAFVLHEIHDAKDSSVLLAGVMDGHGGAAASSLVSSQMPSLVSKELLVNRKSVEESLEGAWEKVCDMYEKQCTDPESCRAEYNPWEGTLKANTGGNDLIPGTTISIMALDETTGKITFLNCGDSRSLVMTSKGKVRFETADHTPQSETSRFQEGIDAGLGYSLPKCKISKWTLSVGAYEYSVARSLEGPFATSKGIVSDPDITETAVESGEILLSASDGLWEVMGSGEVALELHKKKTKGISAGDAARELCSMALKKGSSDNVSAVVVYL